MNVSAPCVCGIKAAAIPVPHHRGHCPFRRHKRLYGEAEGAKRYGEDISGSGSANNVFRSTARVAVRGFHI